MHKLINSIKTRFLPEVKSIHLYSLMYTSGCAGLTLILSFVSNIIWTHYFSPATLGSFRIIITITNIAAAFSLLGISTAIMMSCAENTHGNFRILIRRKLVANGCIAIVLFFFTQIYFSYTEYEDLAANLILVTALLFPIFNLTDIWSTWMNGNKAFGRLAVGRILRALLACASIAAFAIFPTIKLFYFLALYFGLIGIMNILYIYSLKKEIKNDIVNSQTLTFSNHSSIAFIFGSLLLLDVILLGHFFSLEDVAIYAVALIFPELTKSIWAVINQLIAPYAFGSKSLSVFWKKFRSIILATSFLWFLLGIAGFILLPTLIPIFFTNTYSDSIPYAQALWLGYCWCAPGAFFSNSLLSTKKPIFAYFQQAVHPSGTVLLYLIFLDLGIFGFVLAKLIATVTLSAFNIVCFFRLAGMEKKV